jgi:hypothetical protein
MGFEQQMFCIRGRSYVSRIEDIGYPKQLLHCLPVGGGGGGEEEEEEDPADR